MAVPKSVKPRKHPCKVGFKRAEVGVEASMNTDLKTSETSVKTLFIEGCRDPKCVETRKGMMA